MATPNGSDTLEALLRSERNFRTIIERSPLPTCVSNLDRLLYANPAMLDYLGYDGEAGMIGPSLAELSDQLIHPDDRERTRAAFATLFATLGAVGAPPHGSVRLDDVRLRSRRGGALRFCDMHGIVIPHDGAPALVTFLHDHTERRAAMDQVRLADRMSALGTLAAGVAHEINNPLTYVLANMEFVAGKLADPDLATALGDARAGIERIRRIVGALRTFSRSDDNLTAPTDLRTVLDATVEMAYSHLRHRGRLVKRYADTPRVVGSEARLGQVFLNLLLNAAQALDESTSDRNEVTVSVERAGDTAIVTVADNGGGIAAADLPRVFDAFFTTKPVGLGTGLGLFVCHGIVTALGGAIDIDSVHGRGTRVRVTLPIAAAREPAAPAPPEPGVTPHGRVLVVDDEPLVLDAVCRMLEQDHAVIGVTTAQAALDLLVGGERYDVILCDLMMPGMSGIELFDQLVSRLPDVAPRVVFMSGGAVTESAAAFVAQTANCVVAKPFVGDALLVVVREQLAR